MNNQQIIVIIESDVTEVNAFPVKTDATKELKTLWADRCEKEKHYNKELSVCTSDYGEIWPENEFESIKFFVVTINDEQK